ncbi:DUF4230 domain-containing protein [Psychroserpens sp. S379A]|uniref:DUF4230 domain-containing protein n=1 Tax=Psychroserpens sp. S379A TaxID=3415137 RepID=UPI003C7E2FE9
MRKTLFGVIITLLILFTYKYCGDKKEHKITLQQNSALIEKQIKNVGKLIVTEGYFSEVFTYENSKSIFGDFLEAEKKALVVVNAEVTIAYDLSQVEYDIDKATKTLRILSLPKEEIKLNPDFEYYDMQADFFNQFEAKDYNNIKATVKQSLMKKVEASELKSNAKNRLISELAKFYILTNSLGWTLEYKQSSISDFESLKSIKF